MKYYRLNFFKYSYLKHTILTLLTLVLVVFLIKYAVIYFNSNDRYYNGIFPPQSPSEVPYGIAFPSLKFDTPLTFNTIPHQNKLVVGQRDGKIYWFENDQKTTDKNLLADLSDEVGVVWDGGFLGLTIHPNFGTTGKNYFYVFYSSEDSNNKDFPDFYSTLGCDTEEFWGNYLVLERFEVNPITLKLKTGSRSLLLKLRMYGTTHRGGGLQFGNDGFLYLATADQTARVKSQDIKNNLDGGVLRLDVDKDPEKSHRPIRKIQKHGYEDEISGLEYWIPNDNPFLSPDGTNYEEYYTLGHRNPHRMTKDRETGLFYIGEIGEDTHEEINVILKGRNYGWPIYEGDEPGPNCGIKMYKDMPHEYPLVSFPRTDANCVIGGYVYRGDKIPNLYGKYICADYGNGEEIWSVDIKTGDYTLLGNFAPADIVSFGEDAQGNIYILKQGEDVNLYNIMPSTISYEGFPKNITETNIFKNLQTLEVSEDLIPYNLIESSWSDGANKKRWMFIPNTGTNENETEKISFSENEEWEFPIGSVLIVHLDLPIDDKNPQLTKKIETRFSIKGHDGKFYFLTYNWNDEQTEATLQKESIDEQVAINTKDFGVRYQNWHFPSNTECIVCHNGASKGSLGFRTKNLNMEFPHNNTKINQLVSLSDKGIINKIVTDNDTESLPTHKPLNDDTATLNDRARSYLDLNCGYCHRPDTGNRAEFDLRLFNSLEETGLLNAGTLTPLGIEGERILVPGNAEKSILFQRMLSTETTTMMPPLAKGVVDDDAIILIRDWINQLQISIN